MAPTWAGPGLLNFDPTFELYVQVWSVSIGISLLAKLEPYYVVAIIT